MRQLFSKLPQTWDHNLHTFDQSTMKSKAMNWSLIHLSGSILADRAICSFQAVACQLLIRR